MRNRPLEKGILGVGAFVKKTKEQISFNMKHVKNKDSEIEITLRKELWARGLRYRKNVNRIFGKPDIAFIGKKIAVFCDSEFWHGYDWDHKSQEIKSRREFWIPKLSEICNGYRGNTDSRKGRLACFEVLGQRNKSKLSSLCR